MRGEVLHLLEFFEHLRITPACAGRSRTHIISAPFRGSPPRVRGEETGLAQHRAGRGITPACAGRSSPDEARRIGMRDHPRVCGEKAANAVIIQNTIGSPPRVRGEAHDILSGRAVNGITPACAGRSRNRRAQSTADTDHPRVCGEKTFSHASGGSPPRVRGEALHKKMICSKSRITPACAGRSISLQQKRIPN